MSTEGGPVTAPDRAGTPDSRSTPQTAGQAAYEGFVAFQKPVGFEYETWADKDEHGDSAVMGRADWEAAGSAVVDWFHTIAAAAPAGTGAPGLRKALEGLVNFWAVGGNGIDATSEDLISACSAELLRVLDQHPEQPQAAPELAAATPPLGTAWRLLDEARGKLADATAALRDIRDANPDSPAGGYVQQRAVLALSMLDQP